MLLLALPQCPIITLPLSEGRLLLRIATMRNEGPYSSQRPDVSIYCLKNNNCNVKLNVFIVNIVFQIISAKCFKTGQYNSICTCVVVICSQAITYGIQVPFAVFMD